MDEIRTAPPAELPPWAQHCVNLADARLGAVALSCSDDFFAPMDRMLQPHDAQFIVGKYDDNGKWMDGWESRRKRGPGHDWCVIKLGVPGEIHGFDIDTHFFTGNYPPAASIDGCVIGEDPQLQTSWVALLPRHNLGGDRHHMLRVAAPDGRVYSHLRLNIFPDGGIARLRVYGRPARSSAVAASDGLYELSAQVNGGYALAWNDAHYGRCSNMLLPGRGVNMGEGWETRRRREPGNDWCVLALGLPGTVKRVEVDTAHFKGNYPDRCSLHAVALDGAPHPTDWQEFSGAWPVLLPQVKLSADAVHQFTEQLVASGPITHVRLNIFPDGGISRLRLWGVPA